MGRFVLIILSLAIVSAHHTEAANLIVDGVSRTITSGIDPDTYGSIEIRNGGHLTIEFLRYLNANSLLVDASSTISSGYRYYDSNPTPKTGGSNGGLGGGSGASYWYSSQYPAENASRRVDALYPGQGGGVGTENTVYGGNGCSFTIPPGFGAQGTWVIGIRAQQIEIHGKVLGNGQDSPSEPFYPGTGCPGVPDVPFPTDGGGAGAGTSITLIASQLIVGPSATLSANGGSGKLSYGGGGGRIKIYYETGNVDSQAVVETRGGQNSDGTYAEDGTVFIRRVANVERLFDPSADLNGDAIIDQYDLMILSSQWGNAEPTQTPTLTPTRTPTNTPTITPTWHPGMSQVDLVVESGAFVFSGHRIRRNVRVYPGARIVASGDAKIWCDQLELDSQGTITAIGGNAGLGTPPQAPDGQPGAGGSYGGRGEDGVASYGSAEGLTIEPGSRGGRGGNCYVDTQNGPHAWNNLGVGGGGPLEIQTSRILVNGTITANGTTGSTGSCSIEQCCVAPPSGSGSGGGILLIADEIVIGVSAVIRADGGGGVNSSNPQAQRGGGGRIKLFFRNTTNIAPSAVLSATGYEPGTIHIEKLQGQ